MPNVTNESDKFAESPQNKLKCLKIKKKLLATFGCFAFCSSDFSSSSSFFSRSLSVAAFVFVLIVSLPLCVCVALFVQKVCLVIQSMALLFLLLMRVGGGVGVSSQFVPLDLGCDRFVVYRHSKRGFIVAKIFQSEK